MEYVKNSCFTDKVCNLALIALKNVAYSKKISARWWINWTWCLDALSYIWAYVGLWVLSCMEANHGPYTQREAPRFPPTQPPAHIANQVVRQTNKQRGPHDCWYNVLWHRRLCWLGARFSKVPQLSGLFSFVTYSSVSSEWRGFQSSISANMLSWKHLTIPSLHNKWIALF